MARGFGPAPWVVISPGDGPERPTQTARESAGALDTMSGTGPLDFPLSDTGPLTGTKDCVRQAHTAGMSIDLVASDRAIPRRMREGDRRRNGVPAAVLGLPTLRR